MRISIVTYSIKIGGVETVLRTLAEQFSLSGHGVEIIEVFRPGEWRSEFVKAGLSVRACFQGGLQSQVGHARKIARILEGYDAVFLNDVPVVNAVLGLLDCSTARIAIVHSNMISMLRNGLANLEELDYVVGVSPLAGC